MDEKRLISADAFKKAFYVDDDCDEIRFGVDGKVFVDFKAVQRAIDESPTVDAVEVVHARWRWGYNSMNQYGAWCAECECGWEDKGTNDDFIRVQGLVIAHKYCPNCGAKMDGGNEDV